MSRQEEYYWWHVAKRELVLDWLKKYFCRVKGDKEELKILDVGCGTGMMAKELHFLGKVWGVDRSDAALNFCRRKDCQSIFNKGNLERKLSFSSGFFDIILCLDVLEHIKEEKGALSELGRILKTNGILLLSVPAYPCLFSYWDKVAGHYRRYNAKSLKTKLEENGFRPERLTYYNFFVLLPAIVFRLIKTLLQHRLRNINSDFIALPNFFNKFLLFLSKMERTFLLKFDFPVGLSVFCLARKQNR